MYVCILTAPEKVLQMIHCKCETDRPCSQKICSYSKAQLSCSKSSNCYGSMSYNTWTTLDENSNCGDGDGVKKADYDGSADEKFTIALPTSLFM